MNIKSIFLTITMIMLAVCCIYFLSLEKQPTQLLGIHEKEAIDILLNELRKDDVASVKLVKLPNDTILDETSKRIEKIKEQYKPENDELEEVEVEVEVIPAKEKETVYLKKIVRNPSESFVEELFYVDGNKVALLKIVDGSVVDQFGEIPDAIFKVVDEFEKTHGQIQYKDGLRIGQSFTYFKDNQLKEVATYSAGRMMNVKEYYTNGMLRKEVDFLNAQTMMSKKEVGVGKIYYPDGTLRYEWQNTEFTPKGSATLYDMAGNVLETYIHNEEGEPVRIPKADEQLNL